MAQCLRRAQRTAAPLAGGGLRAEQPARLPAALPDAAVRGLLRHWAGPALVWHWAGPVLPGTRPRAAQAHARPAVERSSLFVCLYVCMFVCLFAVRVRRVVFVLSSSVRLTHGLRRFARTRSAAVAYAGAAVCGLSLTNQHTMFFYELVLVRSLRLYCIYT